MQYKDSNTTIVNRHELFRCSSYQTYSSHSFQTHFPVEVKNEKMSTSSIWTQIWLLILSYPCYISVYTSIVHSFQQQQATQYLGSYGNDLLFVGFNHKLAKICEISATKTAHFKYVNMSLYCRFSGFYMSIGKDKSLKCWKEKVTALNP